MDLAPGTGQQRGKSPAGARFARPDQSPRPSNRRTADMGAAAPQPRVLAPHGKSPMVLAQRTRADEEGNTLSNTVAQTTSDTMAQTIAKTMAQTYRKASA